MAVGDGTVEEGFRAAMRRLAGTVTIVTVKSGSERHGTTATAVTSLSMEPPSILVCFNRDTRLHGFLTKEERFCVNLLHTDNVGVSKAFASPLTSEERFAAGNWRDEDAPAPYLADAQASIFCIKEKSIDYASHTIFVGRVIEVRHRDEVSPLIYRDGGYARCAELPGRSGKRK